MAQKTNLNVAPYYDDFNSANNFNRVLFRPGFAVQGRELTQLQTALQDQIRKHGDHVFEEGAMVLPGQISFNTNFYTLKLATQFNSENIDPSKYYNATTPVTITGATTGVKARVIGFTAGSTTEQPLLHIRYMDTGTDNITSEFSDGENISADVGITHITAYSSNVASATTFTATSTSKTDPKGPASSQGSIANVEAGIYYIRGMFIQNTAQTVVLSKYTTTPSVRVGFSIEEKLITPEDDTSLLDNATGSSNFAAKGGHRLQINLTLSSLSLTSTEDDNFVELMKLKNGRMTSQVRITEYSVLEETLARRTFDESGDYTVRPFTFSTQESVTIDDNEGIYTNGAVTDDGGTASDSLLAFKVSPGKAYVKGFEIEKIAPTIKDVNKARDTQSVNNGATTFGLGNFTLVNNVFNTPDITADSGSIVEFAKVDFREYFTATRGTVNTTNTTSPIGSARIRHFEYHSGTVNSNRYSHSSHQSTEYKVYLFDIKPFIRITMSGTISDALVEGDKVTGSTSGATGLVQYQDGAKVFITKINGDFTTGETFIVSDRSSATSETITKIRNYQFSDFKQMTQDNLNGTSIEFTADLVQSDTFTLSGDYRSETTANVPGQNQATTSMDNVVGLSGFNTSEVKLGDVIEFKQNTNSIQSGVVDGITSTAIGFRLLNGNTGTVAADNIPTKVIRKRSKLFDAEKNISVVKLPKDVIKTTSDIIYSVRRQHIITVASGVVTLPTLTSGDETYAPFTTSDYSISLISENNSSGTPNAGDHMEISGFGGTDTARTLTYTSIENGDVVKVIATVRRSNNVGAKTKTPVLSKALKVLSAGEGNFGIFSDDKDISFGRADVFKLQAIYDSESTSTDAVPPKLTVTSINGSFTRGEVITGGTSGAKARIITSTSPIYYVLNSETNFIVGETITGEYGLATATVATVTDGSTVITGNFTLDTGQRDNYYDIGRIIRKPSSPIPTGRLLVIYDYLEHSGTGDFFSVNSYVTGSTGVNLNPGVAVNQMDYNDIPTYSATKVDPDQKEPSGQFPLADCFDFRPRVADIAGTQTGFYADGGTGVDQITGNSFNFGARVFTGTGSSSLNFVKPNTVINADFDFYLNKRALVYINKDGEITVKEGASAEVPNLPKPNEGSMLLADLFIPAYTFEPADVVVTREKNQRFTMRDIGKLKDRIENVEYYTALNMLERDAESFEVQDSNGLSRFKSGFVVDNFSGHRVGDVNHVDYRVGMDFENGELRPIHHTEAIKLVEKDTVDTARTSSHYQKTGDLLTLPYTEEQFTSQPYATTIEKVTPLLTSNWLGKLEITPSSDEWFETEIAPRLVINVEGNYNTFLAANEDKVGTVWNAWQTSWSGVVRSRTATNSMGNFRVTRVIETTRTNLTRRGIRTEVVPKVDEESQGFRKLYDTLVPFCRSTSIQFKAWGLKPNTKVYPFFDKKLVTAHVTPLNANFTSGTVTAGQPLVTDTVGNLEGTFLIPDPKVRGTLKFETGEIQFRLTSSNTNSLVPEPSTAADTIYFAKGILETHQETVIATRNAELVRSNLAQTTSKFSTQSRIVSRVRDDNDRDSGSDSRAPDPLAQTFMVDEEGGIFITSIDLFFAQKDNTLPMWVEIRNVINGYPGPKILPFGTKVIYPSDVTTSTDGSVATKVTFPSPVYVEGGVEYTIALLTAAQINTWSVFIARMGEVEIGGDRTVSLQPHIGVLFKSHNNRAWAMSGMEDLKFNINRAKFNNSTSGTITLNNTGHATPSFKKLLPNNPVRFTQGDNNLRITHRNHGMYDRDTNRVTISGVNSGLSTTLNGDITSSATTINLTDGTLFNETSGKYKHDSSNFHFIKIDDEIIKYTNASISGNTISAGSVTRGVGGTTAAAHSFGATIEYYQLFTVPLHTVNRTHTGVGDVEGLANGNQLDFYTVNLTGLTDFTAVAEVGSAGESINAGGKNVNATQNKMLDGLQTMIGVMELPETTITASCKATSATSPSGTQSSFTKDGSAKVIPLNDNYYFDFPKLIASPINEQLTALNSNKSLDIILSMKSTRDTLSPVIDTQRMSVFAIGNRINKVTSSGSYTVSTNASPSTDPEGDDNAAIYCTKQVLLENPATAIKMFFSGNVSVDSDVVGMFKILRVDDANDFDDIGWQYFNTTGVPDTTPLSSLSETDFQQFMYTAGIKDDGLGTPLEPFIGFAIKLILQGTNSAQVPRLKDFRAIALAT